MMILIFQNKDVTEAIQKVAASYDCKIVEGVLSHQLKQFVIDGNKVVLSVANPETRVDEAEFEENEVYSIDIVTSTGEGKPKLLDEKQTTIYKRAVDRNYHLKMKASRFIFSEITQKYPIMPFTARFVMFLIYCQLFSFWHLYCSIYNLITAGLWKRNGLGLDWWNVLTMIFCSHILFFMRSLVRLLISELPFGQTFQCLILLHN